MKKSLKGALLSGLVFPGLGQAVLGRKARGAVLALAVLAGLSVMVAIAVRTALVVLDRIQAEGGAIDMETITRAAVDASTAGGDLDFNLAMLLVLACWVAATVDAWRIGKGQDMGPD